MPLPKATAPIPKANAGEASPLLALRAPGARARVIAEQRALHGKIQLDLKAGLADASISGVDATRLVTERADYVVRVVDELVRAEIGPPPDDPATGEPITFALFGAGSYGRYELSPYSDLDYGIVVDKDVPEMKTWTDRYAKKLGGAMREIAGDALAPCREMSPTGAMGAAFYGTPEDLAGRAAGTAPAMLALPPREREFITTALCTSRLALGDGAAREVYARFATALREELGPGAPDLVEGSPRAVLVDGLLAGMRDPFGVPERRPEWFGSDNNAAPNRPKLKQHMPIPPMQAIAEGKVNVKHDLLRALQLPIAALRALYDLDVSSSDDVLATLAKEGRMDPALSGKLRWALDAALAMRAKNQLALEAPVDKLRSVTDADKKALRAMVPILFRLRQGMESAKQDKNGFSLGGTA